MITLDTLPQIIAWLILALSAGGAAMVFLVYPACLGMRALGSRELRPSKKTPSATEECRKISMITVTGDAGERLRKKVKNLADLDYPHEKMEFILYGDGVADIGFDIRQMLPGITVRVLLCERHRGKAFGLNKAVAAATGELLVFSDTDAMLDRGALKSLTQYFNDPAIGGVCGLRSIHRERQALCNAQVKYLAFDNLIKSLESRTSSLTSNEGKLYAIRKELFKPVDPAATDDLYTCLAVIRAGYRFVLAPDAAAYINAPSKHSRHELTRRRRVVVRSLHGIYQNRALLNPRRYGFYSFGLFVNKIMRRSLPLFMIGIFISSVALSFQHDWARFLLGAQAVFYCFPVLFVILPGEHASSNLGKMYHKAIAVPTYFILGNAGTLLGVIDFLRGRRITKWISVK